ncbi:hypothetical protein DSBG_1028 [Desulfosporosinus sp. BG]|nr:hypothetical protein DSBG_1028 [Desulfosporosinus sp. BG]
MGLKFEFEVQNLNELYNHHYYFKGVKKNGKSEIRTYQTTC